MLTIQWQDAAGVAQRLKKIPEDLRLGTIEGIRAATELLAKDVIEHTPRKSGKARQSVVTKFSSNGLRGQVAYSYKKADAFYMRFVLLGVKPRPIFPRGRHGSREQRRLRQQAYRRRLDPDYSSLGGEFMEPGRRVKGKIVQSERMVTATEFTGRGGKKALTINGKLYAAAWNYPGFKGLRTLSRRLDAMHDPLEKTIHDSLKRRFLDASRITQ